MNNEVDAMIFNQSIISQIEGQEEEEEEEEVYLLTGLQNQNKKMNDISFQLTSI
jgi:hypothetical protein